MVSNSLESSLVLAFISKSLDSVPLSVGLHHDPTPSHGPYGSAPTEMTHPNILSWGDYPENRQEWGKAVLALTPDPGKHFCGR